MTALAAVVNHTMSTPLQRITKLKISHWYFDQCLYPIKTSSSLKTSSASVFLRNFIARQHTDARYWHSKSICPSVRPSVRLSVRYVPIPDENGLTFRHSFFFIDGSQIILVLPASNVFTKFRRGAKYRWGIKISRFSTNKSLYLANDTKYRHSYYKRRIGNRTPSFWMAQFQWPWVTSNPDFKVTILFNVKKLENGTR